MVEQVLFLRHFPTRQNAEARILGRSLEVPVMEVREIPCDIPVDLALCSPALRCRQTLEVLQKTLALDDVRYLQELTERGMGVMEGCLRCDMVEVYPELFAGQKFRLFETPPEGESFDAFYSRTRRFWEKYQKETDGTLLICSHNQFLRLLYFVIHDLPVDEKRWREMKFPCGEIVKVL